MANPIKFHAYVDDAQAGDDEVRLVLQVIETTADLAAVVEMVTLRNRRLHVEAYLGENEIAEFTGAISAMKTAIQLRSKRPSSIKLDIPASDAIKALRLVGYSERLIRFEVADEGARPQKEKKAPKPKVKTPFGDLWQELLHRNMGFENIPVVNAALESVRSSPHEDAHLLMRKVFGVESLANLIGPDEIRARFPHTAVTGMVQDAGKRIEENQRREAAKTAAG